MTDPERAPAHADPAPEHQVAAPEHQAAARRRGAAARRREPARPHGVSVVVPTNGNPGLAPLLARLAAELTGAPLPVEVIVVDDRNGAHTALPAPVGLTDDAARFIVLAGRAAGVAAARNLGTHAARHDWVVFLDDDVVPEPGWLAALAADLREHDPERGGNAGHGASGDPADNRVDGIRGLLTRPLPAPPVGDVAAATADVAYRRLALTSVGGFDERLSEAGRGDAELAYRIRRAGGRVVTGGRRVDRPAPAHHGWARPRGRAGHADDALLRRLYGPRWHELLQIPAGRRRRHALITGSGLAAALLALASRPWPALRRAAAVAGTAWALAAAEFAAARSASVRRTTGQSAIAAGPGARRARHELPGTSLAIPPLATADWLVAWYRYRRATPWHSSAVAPGRSPSSSRGTAIQPAPESPPAVPTAPPPAVPPAVRTAPPPAVPTAPPPVSPPPAAR